MGPEQSIEGFLKAVEIYRAAGQESLQEVDPALLEVRRDRGLGLGREPVVVHASRLSPRQRAAVSRTHVLLQEGHLWGRKKVAIPSSAVIGSNHVGIRLSLTKEQVAELPPVA